MHSRLANTFQIDDSIVSTKTKIDITTSRVAGRRYVAWRDDCRIYRKTEIGWIDWVKGIQVQSDNTDTMRVVHMSLRLRATCRWYLRPEIRVRSRVRKTSGMHHIAIPRGDSRRKEEVAAGWVKGCGIKKFNGEIITRSLDARARPISLPLFLSLVFFSLSFRRIRNTSVSRYRSLI